MKQIHYLLLFASSLIALPTNCMDLAITNANEKPKSDKIVFLEKIITEINQYKTTNPEKYLNDMGKVANTIYAATFLTEPLNNLKKHYQKTENTKAYAFYNKKFISGFRYPILEKTTDQYHTIATPLGCLFNYTADYGDQEYNIFLTTAEERAFAKKIESVQPEGRERILKFLKRHLESNNPKIKNIAKNYTYVIASEAALKQIDTLFTVQEHLNQEAAKNYFTAFNLKDFLKKELISTSLAINAFHQAEDAPTSFIEKIKPLCTSKLFNELEKESKILNDFYKAMLKDCNETVANYAETTLKHNKTKIKHHELCNQILNQHFSVAPELKDVFSLFGIDGYIPGIWPFQAPQSGFTSVKTQPTSGKKKKRNRKHKPKSAPSAINQLENIIEQKNDSAELNNVNANNVAEISTREKLIKNSKKDYAICYDERVLLQNTNKKDLYHGFTLITAPYIIKYGKEKIWINKKTNHKDTLITINGEIEYTKKNIVTSEYVQFDLCIGADDTIYHIGMRTTKETNNNQAYDVVFPPLGTIVQTNQSSTSDDYNSKVLKETDYMIQIWDGGLNATITLYK